MRMPPDALVSAEIYFCSYLVRFSHTSVRREMERGRNGMDGDGDRKGEWIGEGRGVGKSKGQGMDREGMNKVN